MLLVLGACAQPPRRFAEPPLDDSRRLALHRVAVVESRLPPEMTDFTREEHDSKLEGAGKGAATGLSVLVQGCAELQEAGVLCVYFAPVLVPTFAALGAVVGADGIPGYAGNAAVSAIQTRSRQATDKLRLDLRDAVARTLARDSALEVVTGSFPGPLQQGELDASTALAYGFDAILSVRLLVVDPYWKNKEIGVEMVLSADLVDGSGRLLAQSLHSARTERRRIEDWNDAELRVAIARARNLMAADVVEEFFLIAHMPGDPREVGRGYLLEPGAKLGQGRASLRPETFLERHLSSRGTGLTTRWRYLAPSQRFEWEPFERRWSEGPLIPTPLEDVTYDFRIFSAEYVTGHWKPDVLIYERSRIDEPYHLPDVGLKPCKRFYWTVRARFRAADQVRVTEWAGPLRYEAEAAERRADELYHRWGYGFMRLPKGRTSCSDRPG